MTGHRTMTCGETEGVKEPDTTININICNRYSVFNITVSHWWRLHIVLSKAKDITAGTRVIIKQGNVYANKQFGKMQWTT